MRKPVVLVAAGLLAATLANAKKPKADPRLAWVEDEPMSLRVLEAPSPRLAEAPSPGVETPSQVTEAPSPRLAEAPSPGVEAPSPRMRPGGGRGLDDAKLMSAGDMRGPEVPRTRATGPLSEANLVPPRTGREDAPVSGAVDELVARQMRRHQASIDTCIQEAAKRRPTINGTVTLRVVVSNRQVASVHVVEDGVFDVDFDLCLVKAGRNWRFDLHKAAFTWPVSLSTSAKR
jgi:hypothetical protein